MIRTINIETQEDMDKVQDFAKKNAGYIANELAMITTMITNDKLDMAVIEFSKVVAESYTSGVVDGMAKNKGN